MKKMMTYKKAPTLSIQDDDPFGLKSINIQGHISESSNEEASEKVELYDENTSQVEANLQLKFPPIDMNKVTSNRDFLKNLVHPEENIIMKDDTERTTIRAKKKPMRNNKIKISVQSKFP